MTLTDLKKLASDEEAHRLAKVFFKAAEDARLHGNIGEHGFTMRRSNIVFPYNEHVLQALASLITRCIEKLGSIVGNENGIAELAWEEAAECQRPDITVRSFFSKLGDPASYKSTYIVSNYVVQVPPLKVLRIGDVEAGRTDDLAPAQEAAVMGRAFRDDLSGELA